jgi:hypothetical protein
VMSPGEFVAAQIFVHFWRITEYFLVCTSF